MNKKFQKLNHLYLLGSFIFLGLLFSPFLSRAFVFNSNLRLGSEGLEIKILQLILNLDPKTQVSSAGVGSLGQETSYFGEKTRQAVLKYQDKNNIYSESGWLGPLTRAKLNNFLTSLLAPPSQTQTSTSSSLVRQGSIVSESSVSSVILSGPPVLESLSPRSGGNNASITIRGKNLSPRGNIVRATYNEDVLDVPSPDGKTLTFTFSFPEEIFIDEDDGLVFPGNFNLPVSIWVTNSNGTSNEMIYDFHI